MKLRALVTSGASAPGPCGLIVRGGRSGERCGETVSYGCDRCEARVCWLHIWEVGASEPCQLCPTCAAAWREESLHALRTAVSLGPRSESEAPRAVREAVERLNAHASRPGVLRAIAEGLRRLWWRLWG